MIGARNNLQLGDPPFPSRSITFDSAAKGTSAYTHTVGTNATALFVTVWAYTAFGCGVTISGVSSPTLIYSQNNANYIVLLYYVPNPPKGAVTITPSASFQVAGPSGASVSYNGVVGGPCNIKAGEQQIPSFAGSMVVSFAYPNASVTALSSGATARIGGVGSSTNPQIYDAPGGNNVKLIATSTGFYNTSVGFSLK
jgi:hypothetical protein